MGTAWKAGVQWPARSQLWKWGCECPTQGLPLDQDLPWDSTASQEGGAEKGAWLGSYPVRAQKRGSDRLNCDMRSWYGQKRTNMRLDAVGPTVPSPGDHNNE